MLPLVPLTLAWILPGHYPHARRPVAPSFQIREERGLKVELEGRLNVSLAVVEVERTFIRHPAFAPDVVQPVVEAEKALTRPASPPAVSHAVPSVQRPAVPSVQDCLTFALPALGIYVASPLLSLIDVSIVGMTSGVVDLAALGPAGVRC